MASLSAGEIFTAYVPGLPNNEGVFNYGRVRINSTLDGTALGQWTQAGGLTGVTATGEVWNGFARFKMRERNLFEAISNAGSVTVTTGLIAKTRGSTRDNNFGIPVEVFLVLDPNGQFVAQGAEPNIFNAWDWADELGLGYNDRVSLGIIQPGDYDMADQTTLVEYPMHPGAFGLSVNHPAMVITFDITQHLEQWRTQGLLTANSSIAIGFYQRFGNIVNEQGQPDPFNPTLLPAQNEFMLFEVANMHLTVSDAAPAPTWAGFAKFEDGWVYTGGFLGFVFPVGDFVFVDALQNWIYLPESLVEQGGAWTYVFRP
ncbi:MAG: hypothetical protein LR015_09495 [Verrucomicrobia bacterium]|nr:hypothetical protein [Verrucomicrobiota bacterium]